MRPGLGTDPFPAVDQLPGPVPEPETASPHQLGELLVFGRILQPLPPRPLAEVLLDLTVRSLVHPFSRSRHRMKTRR